MGKKKKARWMQHLSLRKGALHEQLHVPADEKIPAAKLSAAAHSSNPLLKKRAILAQTFRKAQH
jgi:hypothetical protein